MSKDQIQQNSAAEYFTKNLQQVGFSSPTKAVLTTIKEAIDNALDACEDNGIPPEVTVIVKKLGAGHAKNTDQIKITVIDNGPGIPEKYLPQVFGQFLASSKFGKGRCTRGQQGIGISAATAYAQSTNASGAQVVTKQKGWTKAISAIVEVDQKTNTGVLKNKKEATFDGDNGTSVEFVIDGKIQLNGDAGLIAYLNGTAMVNPHLTLNYSLDGHMDGELQTIKAVSKEVPMAPEAEYPHPHTMKLGEFINYAKMYPESKVDAWLKNNFSRGGTAIGELEKSKAKATLKKKLKDVDSEEHKVLFSEIQNIKLMAPASKSVMAIGEDLLKKTLERKGNIQFAFAITRKPAIVDFKTVQVEVAIAKLNEDNSEDLVDLYRFANRVPLQFDKSSCAITKAAQTVNWRAYGLDQSKGQLPTGPYVIAVSVISPFIKFKNASKETIDASDELVEEIRLALIQAGQKIGAEIKKLKAAEEEAKKKAYVDSYGQILIDSMCRILQSSEKDKKLAQAGLKKILGQ